MPWTCSRKHTDFNGATFPKGFTIRNVPFLAPREKLWVVIFFMSLFQFFLNIVSIKLNLLCHNQILFYFLVASIWHIGTPVSETRNVNKLTAAPMAGATTPIHKKLPTMESKTTQPHLATLPLTQSRSDPVVCEGSFLRCNESLTVSTGVSISTPSSPSALGGERAGKNKSCILN